MKKIYITLLTLMISLFMVTGTAYARVALFINPAGATSNLCPKLEGTWTGVGTLDNVFSSCEYKGTAKISGSDKMVAETTLEKVAGPDWCQDKITMKMNGICENNIADFDNQKVHLSGKTSGNSVTIEGTIDLGLNTYLEVDLKKQPS